MLNNMVLRHTHTSINDVMNHFFGGEIFYYFQILWNFISVLFHIFFWGHYPLYGNEPMGRIQTDNKHNEGVLNEKKNIFYL